MQILLKIKDTMFLSNMSFYNKKNILVTGAAGITGHSAIKRLLDEGAYVRATVYNNRNLDIHHKNLEIVKCDLMNHEDCIKVLNEIGRAHV